MDQSVVFITVDCLRADHVGCYGYERDTTPNIDEFAADAQVFEYAYANAPGTTWAFQTLHGGIFPFEIDGIGLPDTAGTTLAEVFQQAGYRTGGFAFNGNVSRDFNYDRGFDEFTSVQEYQPTESTLKRIGRKANNLTGGFLRDTLYEVYLQLGQVSSADSEFQESVTDRDVFDDAIGFAESEGSYFLWVHSMDAHTPYSRWNKHLEALRGDTDIEHVPDPSRMDLESMDDPPEAVIDAYDAGIRSADEQVGRLLDTVSDDTIVIITGDHGEEFGRHNPFHHASPLSPMTQVPIIVRAPGVNEGRLAEHLDIPVTLVELLGEDIPETWRGQPLTEPKPTDKRVFIQVDDNPNRHNRQVGLRVEEWKYVREVEWKYGKEGREALYRVPHMDAEKVDIASEHPDKFAEMKSIVEEHEDKLIPIGKGVNPQGQGEYEGVSEAVNQNLEDLGYIEK